MSAGINDYFCVSIWAMRRPEIRSYTILGISVWVSLNEINILIGRLKQIAFFSVSEPYQVRWRPEENQNHQTSLK
jgi:hypothetical protein